MQFLYPSGEVVHRGDRIRYGDSPGEVEFVADPDSPDPATAWYIDEFGGGCMIATEKFGSVFLKSTADHEDLEFISRMGG